MHRISVKEFLSWKKKQLSKGGDYESLAFLLDINGGLSSSEINLLTINHEGSLYLKKKIKLLRKNLG